MLVVNDDDKERVGEDGRGFEERDTVMIGDVGLGFLAVPLEAHAFVFGSHTVDYILRVYQQQVITLATECTDGSCRLWLINHAASGRGREFVPDASSAKSGLFLRFQTKPSST